MSGLIAVAAIVVYVLLLSASVAVAWMMLTGKGWWHVDEADRIDWMTTARCPRCDAEPLAPSLEQDLRDLHVAWHALVAKVIAALGRKA